MTFKREITHRQHKVHDHCALHSVLLQQTQIPSFKSIGHEITKLCPEKYVNGARAAARTDGRPYALGDRPVFDELKTIKKIGQNMLYVPE